MSDEEVKIPIKRDFLIEKGFSERDRNEKYSDEEFIDLLVNRVRCLDPSCDHYFEFRPGWQGSTEGKCWSCDREYVIHDDKHMWATIDHGPMTVAVENPDDETGGSILLVGATGEGWALADYMEWIGEDYEIEDIEAYVAP